MSSSIASSILKDRVSCQSHGVPFVLFISCHDVAIIAVRTMDCKVHNGRTLSIISTRPPPSEISTSAQPRCAAPSSPARPPSSTPSPASPDNPPPKELAVLVSACTPAFGYRFSHLVLALDLLCSPFVDDNRKVTFALCHCPRGSFSIVNGVLSAANSLFSTVNGLFVKFSHLDLPSIPSVSATELSPADRCHCYPGGVAGICEIHGSASSPPLHCPSSWRTS